MVLIEYIKDTDVVKAGVKKKLPAYIAEKLVKSKAAKYADSSKENTKKEKTQKTKKEKDEKTN